MVNKNKINLEEFAEKQKFSNQMFKKIFKELVTKSGGETARKRTIRAIIAIWEKKYPEKVKEFDNTMRKIRNTRTDKFASSKEDDLRLLFKIPTELWDEINTFMALLMPEEKPFLNKKEEKWFFKNFKRYVVPEKY